MVSENHPKILIVEGNTDKRVIPELMEKNGIVWPDKKHPVQIKVYGGDRQINRDRIRFALQQSGLKVLGIMLDADNNFSGRWESIRNICTPLMSDFPEELPETGLIHTAPNGVKFGVWIMPDNQNRGMLETFLAYLIPDRSEPIWDYAKEATQEAKKRGAPFIEPHTDKANIHTWLAWQNEPGNQLHTAIMAKIFEPTHPKAQIFVNWFKTLYDL
ncbi:DUF3226 domain-containing protein [Spirulina sp. 06S082]|uniref:DUF3226 domain-containing protein n=1 Tax=Spirulina sp. 06S082 TaxID=3110248 RepID=UPI002B20E996|nr:DUF3226 domain-containing protein [Spirulina sp. 06S082]MEA5470330.1 DUF3226 domain-containing protein [Spirulina sp. 06S082]